MDYKQIAKEVIEALGGRENVNSVAHCATRLRVMVKDENKINKEKAENIEKVQGAFFNSGQYQMIFGTGTVNKIYDEIVAQGLPTASKDEQKAEAAKQGNWFQRAIRSFGDVFVPLLPAIVATGLFMGIRGAINNDTVLALFGTTSKAFAATDFYTYTVVLTDTAFAFFPALICWSAFNVFGGSPLLGLVLGLMMVNNALPNAWDVASGAAKPIYFFDFIPVVGYQNSVLPAFFVGLIGAKFEQWVRKWVPDVLDLLLRPLVVFAVMSALALFIIGPVFHTVESYVLAGTEWILALPFGLAGLVLGGIHQIIVVTGVHHVFNLLEANLISNTGKDPLNAIITAAMTAQAGATLAVGVKTKDSKLKALAFPASLSAVLGITEPAIFGVNLRFGKPFIMGLIAGAAGGWLASILNLAGTGFGVTIVPGTLLYLNGQVLKYVIMVLVTLARFAQAVPEGVPVLVCCAVCAASAANFLTTPSVSLEGRTVWLLQSLPIPSWQALCAKLELHLLLTGVPAALCLVCMQAAVQMPTVYFCLTLLEAELFVLLSAEMGLALGLVLPNLHWTSEAAVIKMSGCTLLSMAANLVAVLVLTLAQTNLLTILPLPAVMAAALVLLAGADGLLGHWLKTRGARRLAELS